jgi:hypothetical protein
MSNDRTLSLSTVTATINAPIEKVNLADWLLRLPDAEYQRCAHAHIAAGTTTTDDGRASPAGRTRLQVIWELSAKKTGDQTCEFTNHIHSSAIDETLTFFDIHGVPFERARDARQQASHAHNLEETPNFARSIERRALSRG